MQQIHFPRYLGGDIKRGGVVRHHLLFTPQTLLKGPLLSNGLPQHRPGLNLCITYVYECGYVIVTAVPKEDRKGQGVSYLLELQEV